MIKETRVLLMALMILPLALLPRVGMADDGQCGLASRDDNLFEPSRWPAAPFEEYAQGKLGVLLPTFDHFYLFIAYRKLSGLAISKQDIERLRTRAPCFLPGNSWGWDISETAEFRTAFDEWEKVRNAISPSRQPALTSPVSRYPRYNCNPDAYRNAAKTIRARLASYGNGDDVRTWIRGQDAVFDACAGNSQALPEIVPASAPRWLWLDRQYQFAAAYFYLGKYDEAIVKFDTIASTSDSPWRQIAPYLSARALIRSVTAKQGYQEPLDKSPLRRAENYLGQFLLNAKADKSMREDGLRLMRFVQLRTRSEDTLKQLDDRLRDKTLSDSVGQDVTDFWYAFDSAKPNTAGDLSAWIAALRNGDSALAYTTWKNTKKLPWLVAAMMLVERGGKESKDLMNSAKAVGNVSPAYLTVKYHTVRLMDGDEAAIETAKKLLDDRRLMANYQIINSFRSLALGRSKSIRQLALFVPRVPPERTASYAPTVDLDGANVLNTGLSLDQLKDLLNEDGLPERFSHELTEVVWTRAFVLGRWDLLKQLANRAKTMMPSSAALIDEMLATGDSRGRKAMGAMLLARYPGIVANMDKSTWYNEDSENGRNQFAGANMHPSFSRDGERANWWCVMETEFPGSSWNINPTETLSSGIESLFLDEQSKGVLKAERVKLNEVGNATNYLGKIIMDWAADHQRDPLLPQALHMLVKSTRGGCIDGASGLSKAMFQHLH
ncbi:MAG: hypothetical protein QM808_02090 [Steroidobacteraceae bacterium]